MDKLERIGFSDWFRSKIDVEKAAKHELARVVSVHKESYVLSNGQLEAFAQLSGNLLYSADSSMDLPTTGDWVYANFYDDDTHAIVYGVVPRKTLLKRKTPGKLVDFQLIGANIDVAFIVQSSNENFNLRRLERYLVMVNEAAIAPVILLSKSDLISTQETQRITLNIHSIAPHTKVLACSNVSGENIDVIKGSLSPGKTYCLIGSSGVGKTSLLNSILGGDAYKTQAVSSKESKGRHTTTSRELIALDNGAMLLDTPGMRELGNISVDAGLDETFSDILALARNCKYGDCSHTEEKGCAILAAIEQGELAEQRYRNYTKMQSESKFNEMSYAEKRRKDRDFGKRIKATMKNKNRW